MNHSHLHTRARTKHKHTLTPTTIIHFYKVHLKTGAIFKLSHANTHICRWIQINKSNVCHIGVHNRGINAHTFTLHVHAAINCRPGTDQGGVQADTHTSLKIYVMGMRRADRFCSPKHFYSSLLDQKTHTAEGLMFIHVNIKRGRIITLEITEVY